MKVQRFEELYGHKLTVRELVENYYENTKTGEVRAFNGKLNVRPPYQREFVYADERRNAVIDTVYRGFPLSIMYWCKLEDGSYELLDGQQRTISICKYVSGGFHIIIDHAGTKASKYFSGLTETEKAKILDYELEIYVCEGKSEEKMDWFRVINKAGLTLTEQELENAIHNGPWVTDAKRYFSAEDCNGYYSEGHVSNNHTYADYLNVKPSGESENSLERQKLMEIAISWAVNKYNLEHESKITLDDYMAMHERDDNALGLWRYYEDVMEWVKAKFVKYREYMKGVEWGKLYNRYHTLELDPEELETKITAVENKDITSSCLRNIFEYVITEDKTLINPRAFSDSDKRRKYNEQNGDCAYCHKHFDNYKDMQADHIVPWSKGGETTYDNLQLLCPKCNGAKSDHDEGYYPWDDRAYDAFEMEEEIPEGE